MQKTTPCGGKFFSIFSYVVWVCVILFFLFFCSLARLAVVSPFDCLLPHQHTYTLGCPLCANTRPLLKQTFAYECVRVCCVLLCCVVFFGYNFLNGFLVVKAKKMRKIKWKKWDFNKYNGEKSEKKLFFVVIKREKKI